MKLVVTIYEETFDAALAAIREVRDGDMVELRAERFAPVDFHLVRRATTKPIIATWRGLAVSDDLLRSALDAGIDFVDVEWREELAIGVPRERVVLSHHDYEGMPDAVALLRMMSAYECAHTKLAVTPRTLDENFALLDALAALKPSATKVSVIGMGEQGLFSRILAPFRGSELTFVAATNSAAPGQLTLDRALAIYGGERDALHAAHVFAIAGNPARHSLSPAIHNPLFREKDAGAAYTIASFENFSEIAKAFAGGRIRGLSVTAPFKQDAFAFAEESGAHIRHNAREAGSVNTLVRLRDGCIVADNTDVDGFAALIGGARRAAVVGAGGTARAALVALERSGAAVRVFSRSQRSGFPRTIEPLERLEQFDGDLIIDTLPAGAEVSLPMGVRVIEARYTGASGSGYELLRAQAVRQNELFIEAIS